MMSLPQWLDAHPVLGIPLPHWLYAIGTAVVAYAIVHAALRALARRLHKLDERRPGTTAIGIVSAVLGNTRTRLLLLLFVLIAIHSLGLSKTAELWLGRAAFAVAGLQIGLWLSAAVKVCTHEYLTSKSEHRSNPIILAMASWFALIVIWTIILLAVLANMGMNVTAFVASLGIGGIAVALALQNVLKDLFASLAIGFDEPFEIGDSISFDDISGTVIHVGVKTTRLRTSRGEELAIGNANLLDKTIHNLGRMPSRRMVVHFGISMETPPEKIRMVIESVRGCVQAISDVTCERVHFTGLGSSSMEFEVVCTSANPDYTRCMDIQQDINIALLEHLRSIGVQIAIPAHVQYSSPCHQASAKPVSLTQHKNVD